MHWSGYAPIYALFKLFLRTWSVLCRHGFMLTWSVLCQHGFMLTWPVLCWHGAVVPVLVLLFVALWFILRDNLFYVLPCVIFILFYLFFFFFALVFFSPFSIATTSIGEERANLGAFCAFVRFAPVWFLFSLPLGVWDKMWLVIVALPGLFHFFFFYPKMPVSKMIIIKGDIKPALVADTAGTVSTGNLGDHDLPVSLLVSRAPLRGHDLNFLGQDRT